MTAPKRTARTRTRRGNGEGTITKRADGRFAAALWVDQPDGTRGRKWIYGRTRAEVAGKLTEVAQKVNSGSVMPTRSPTVAEFLDYWLREVVDPKLRPTTASRYRSVVVQYLRPGLGKHRLEKLTVSAVQMFLNRQQENGRSTQTLRMIREVLSSALGRAMREELVGRNVALLTTLPTPDRRRRTAWTAAQARQFLAVSVQDALHTFFVLAVVYGMRRGEIAALCWEDVDFDRGKIIVRASLVRVGGRLVRGRVKTAAGERMLPLVPTTRKALQAQRKRQLEQRFAAGPEWEDSGYVFTTRTGRPIEPRNASRSFDRIVAGTALPKIAFHDLRRTAATMLKSLGVPARDAMVILGHSHITVTLGIYSEVFDDELASAVGRIETALGGVEIEGSTDAG
ncbi:site-specific integrase [Pseudonocardia halophobica]|uniref:Site-specific integrase n=1 Tax=Pseudonocardia halophobica TaxID=29401 RepID=A0A9W6L1E2_9PSEU|nr:tyrosine-type recombinase/integrase [Pseudonocardia halophobica]GLL10459.1 site-specific integrase [Pseudonocardia halophobica]